MTGATSKKDPHNQHNSNFILYTDPLEANRGFALRGEAVRTVWLPLHASNRDHAAVQWTLVSPLPFASSSPPSFLRF